MTKCFKLIISNTLKEIVTCLPWKTRATYITQNVTFLKRLTSAQIRKYKAIYFVCDAIFSVVKETNKNV